MRLRRGKTPVLKADRRAHVLHVRAGLGRVHIRVDDYYPNGKRWWIRLHEKGGKRHEVPAHQLTPNPMTRTDVLRIVKRRALEAGLPSSTCCHAFRATGITAYLENGGMIENAQAIAAHESQRTTKLYDRTSDEITLDGVERIAI